MTDLERIQDIVIRAAGIESIPPEADMYEAGVTSMGSMDVLLELEIAFAIAIADEHFVKARTCEQLLRLVEAAKVGR